MRKRNGALVRRSVVGIGELLLSVLVIAAIAGGIGVSPFLWLLLLVAAVVFLLNGGLGAGRGSRV
jgi:hypothetical protein